MTLLFVRLCPLLELCKSPRAAREEIFACGHFSPFSRATLAPFRQFHSSFLEEDCRFNNIGVLHSCTPQERPCRLASHFCCTHFPLGYCERRKWSSCPPLLITQSWQIFSGVGQNIAMHASPTARKFSLVLFSTFPAHSEKGAIFLSYTGVTQGVHSDHRPDITALVDWV